MMITRKKAQNMVCHSLSGCLRGHKDDATGDIENKRRSSVCEGGMELGLWATALRPKYTTDVS